MNLKSTLGLGVCMALMAWSAAAQAFNPLSLPDVFGAETGGRALYLDAGVFAASDFSSIRQLQDDVAAAYAPRGGKNLVMATARVESGAQWNGWRLGALERQEWLAQIDPTTIELYRVTQASQNYPAGARYTLDYRLQGFSASGLTLGKTLAFPFGDWQFGVGATASLLKGKLMREENWQGSAAINGADNFHYTLSGAGAGSALNTAANSQIFGTFDTPFRFGNPSGSGYALDLALRLARADGMALDWTLGDALGEMRWRDIPQRLKSGDECTYQNGNLTAICRKGKNIRVDLDARLPVKQQWRLALPAPWLPGLAGLAEGRVELSDSFMQGEHFPAAGVSFEPVPRWRIQIDHEARFGSTGVALSHEIFRFELRSDRPALSKARALGLAAGLHVAF